jgi:hypothetical protein
VTSSRPTASRWGISFSPPSHAACVYPTPSRLTSRYGILSGLFVRAFLHACCDSACRLLIRIILDSLWGFHLIVCKDFIGLFVRISLDCL